MSSNEVVKSVAKKLKYYFEIKRLEDGFDLSDVHQPLLDHPPLKARPAMQYEGLHDRALKHYFSQPEVRVQLTQLNGQNGKKSLHGRREMQVRRMLDSYMKHYSFQEEYLNATPRKRPASPKRNPLPSCYYSRGHRLKPEAVPVLYRNKKPKNLLGGWPTLRSVPDQHISRGEAARLVNSATKILVASAIVDNLETSNKPHKKVKPASAPKSFENKKGPYSQSQNGFCTYEDLLYQTGSKSRRPATAKFSWESSKHSKGASAKLKAFDDTYVEKKVRPSSVPARPRSPTPSQSTTATNTTATTTTVEEKPVTRPRSAKYRSRTIINIQERRPHEEVAVIRATQTAADYDIGASHDRQLLEKFDKLEEEVTEGPWCEYQVYVCTGNRIGASTKAPIKLTMYGEKGRTKEFILENSKRHKIPFQKGKEDLFLLAAHHIGRIRKIQIGHDRPELSYAWYLEGVTIYDMTARRIFQFPCERWLSGQDGDKKTYRIVPVDREREFIDALKDEEGLPKSPRHYLSESEGSSVAKEEQLYTAQDDFSTRVRPGDDVSDSSDTDSSSGSSEDAKTHREAKKVAVNDHGSTPRQKKKVGLPMKDDYDEKAQAGTVITLHSATDSKQVDEIYIDPSKKNQQKSGDEYVEGYKAALLASEQEEKKRLEREREIERALLQGKSIHDAVRDNDMDRVKDLLHHFPEMRDFKDESSWTPLHLAAARGNLDMLRWLVTSDADINAETSTGYNSMHIAAMNGHVNAMMLLQAMGSSIFGVTSEKQTVLHLAAKGGFLECVKWLVANRASLVAEDTFGRTPLKLAEDFNHEACADFLRVCMRELANPRSTFAMMHGSRMGGSGLPPIDEDGASASSGTPVATPWHDDIKGHRAESDSEDEIRDKKKHDEELKEKRKLYNEQHQKMDDRGMSFLDSIRQDASEV